MRFISTEFQNVCEQFSSMHYNRNKFNLYKVLCDTSESNILNLNKNIFHFVLNNFYMVNNAYLASLEYKPPIFSNRIILYFLNLGWLLDSPQI